MANKDDQQSIVSRSNRDREPVRDSEPVELSAVRTFEEELNILKGDLSHIHIMVLGDVMIDRYTMGTTSRISPEAPVPVILWKKTEDRLGGASNVAANLKSMGCRVSLMGLCGNDPDADILEKLLYEIGCDEVILLRDSNRPTTVKTRIVAELHQIARIDHESDDEIPESIIEKGLEILKNSFAKNKIDVLILQDYNKGLLHSGWIDKILQTTREHGVKVAVDPKRNHFFEYKNVDLFKPNLKEALQIMDMPFKNLSDLPLISKSLKEKIQCHKLMITLASDGIWIESEGTGRQFLTRPRRVADVSGAGDTVIALAAICMACALSDVFMANCCNAGGGQVCEKFGILPVKKAELIDELQV
jgi:rfaE bifunctional protein kinase chain/domain